MFWGDAIKILFKAPAALPEVAIKLKLLLLLLFAACPLAFLISFIPL